MAQARGYLSQCVLDFEQSYNTDPATAAGRIMPFNTCDLMGSMDTQQPATITNRRDPAEPIDGNVPVDGSIQVPVDYTAFGFWLRAMFDAPVSVTGTGPYVHTFKVGAAQPSILMQRKFADNDGVITYVKQNGIKISRWNQSVSSSGGELVAELTLAGGSESKSATAYDAAATAQILNRLPMKPCTVTEGGTGLIGVVKEADFSIDFGLDTEQFVLDGLGTRGDIPEGLLSLSGNLTSLFKTTDLLDKAFDRTPSSLSLQWTSGSYGVKVTFNELKYGRRIPANEGPKGVVLTLPFTAYYKSHADDASVVVELTSDIESFTA